MLLAMTQDFVRGIIDGDGGRIYFPNSGLFPDGIKIDNVMFTIPGIGLEIYWYGFLIALGMVLAMVYAYKNMRRFGLEPDRVTDTILAGFIGGIIGARAYYVIFSIERYLTDEGTFDLKAALRVRDGGLAIYGGVIGALLFGVIMAKIRKVKLPPMLDLVGMGFLIGQCIGRWGNFFNQEAFGCNTTLPWGMFSEATEDYLMGSTVTVPKGVTIDPAMPVHPTFLYESIWCFVGLALLAAYIKKRKFNGDIALRYLVWYGAGRFWIESLRTDSLLLVPSLGLRASQLVAAAAVVGGVALEIFLTRKYKSKPLMVTLALTAENRSLLAKVRKAEPEFTVEREELVASSPRKLFLERTNAYNERVKQQLKEKLAEKN